MRYPELHSAGGAIQAVLQLRSGRLGAGLHPLHVARRPAAVRFLDTEAHLFPDLQSPIH